MIINEPKFKDKENSIEFWSFLTMSKPILYELKKKIQYF